MDDEVIQADETAVSNDEQTTTATDNGSEADLNASGGRGDVSVALKQERQKRRELEERLNKLESDPSAVYELARKVGLTEEQAEQVAETQAQQVAETQAQPNQFDVGSQVRFHLNREKALDKYPELKNSTALQKMATALLDECDNDPLKAADKLFKDIIGKVKEEAKIEGATIEKGVISEKEKAQTVNAGASPSADQSEYEQLLRDSKSSDKKTQEEAIVKLLMLQNKKK